MLKNASVQKLSRLLFTFEILKNSHNRCLARIVLLQKKDRSVTHLVQENNFTPGRNKKRKRCDPFTSGKQLCMRHPESRDADKYNEQHRNVFSSP